MFRRLLTPGWLAVHALVWAAVAVFLALGWWQAGRAAEGNMLSWAYTFEWPLFALFTVFIWIREMRLTVRKEPVPSPDSPKRPAPVITRRESAPDEDGDPALAAYNRYLAWLSSNPQANPKEYSC